MKATDVIFVCLMILAAGLVFLFVGMNSVVSMFEAKIEKINESNDVIRRDFRNVSDQILELDKGLVDLKSNYEKIITVISSEEKLESAEYSKQRKDLLIVEINNNTIELERSLWKPLDNEYEFAENFQSNILIENSIFGTVLTIFKLPMTNSSKVGFKLSENEFLELFHVGIPEGANNIVCKLKVDKGDYWLSTRDTFRLQYATATKVSNNKIEFDRAYGELEHTINRLRYVLSMM